MFAIGELNTSIISFKNLYNSKLNFGDIDIQNLKFNLKTYKGETDTNLDYFVAKFDDDNPRDGPSEFLFSSSDITIENGRFALIDENKTSPELFVFNEINANTTNFLIYGPNVSSRINKFSFRDSRGVRIKNLMADFEYALDHMTFGNLNISTEGSELKGNLRFNYKREDLKDFTDKVNIEASFRDSKLSLTELNAFFDEFGIDQTARLNMDLTGTLNDLKASNLNISTTRNTEIIGAIDFKNLFNTEQESFILSGRFQKLSSNYKDLVALLPGILGRSIPTVLDKVGNFRINGTTVITQQDIDADISVETDIGLLQSNLQITDVDDIDKAKYVGKVVFDEFNIGAVINDSLAKNVSLNLDVNGKGFTMDELKSEVTGEVFSLDYNNYTYKNITVSGILGNRIFNGILTADDPNFQLTFNGLADLSEEIRTFDFKADVKYANLRILNFVSRDTISEFKGFVNISASGSSYENADGRIRIKNTTYTNQDDEYRFEDFDIVSEFKGKQRTITVNSPDIVEGEIKGEFKIKDIPELIENSIGSIYANYDPHEIAENQYLDFRFNIYSKIAAVFFKDLFLSENTFIEGRMESKDEGFNLVLKSPEIRYQDNFVQDFSFTIDNSNPIYNTYIEIDSISAVGYQASKFSLINVTKRDTLLIKTQFKGGTNNRDSFDLNMFYTIDKDNMSVVGFRKSDFTFKEFDWYINSEKDTLNKIRFDRQFKSFDINPIKIDQGNEEIVVSGKIKDSLNKNIKVSFSEVELEKITPRVDSLDLQGVVNGYLDLGQTDGVYLPKSNINISTLFVNDYDMGDLSAKVIGNNSITEYEVDISLVNDNLTSLAATGLVDVNRANPNIRVNVTFDEFFLNPFNPLGEGVISNIRGLVSGQALVSGSLNKPSIDGELFLDRAGLSIPYLNVDYGFDFDSKVTLSGQRFIFNNVAMTDSKFFSQGYLNGFIEHDNFSDWTLGLDLNTDRLLVLNTEETEESLYYGDGFVSGEASITGPTDQLTIKVDGSTAKGTVFNIPLNDSESFGDNSFINFLSPEEKEARIKGVVEKNIEVKGLELNFDLDVNENALIEIVIDKEAGSTIKGRGQGTLAFLINTNGTFNMWGDFSVFEGIYNFKYGGIVQKRFEVEQGGSIVWEGDPMKAEINLKAVYKTTANPSVLLDNPISQRIPVEVEIQLTGQLEQPDPNFDLRFPNVNSTLKAELDYRLSSKDERDLQALTLLGTGGFTGGAGGPDFTGTISERLTGIVNNILGDDNENLNIGVDLELGQDTPELQTDNRVGLTLQTKISEKILINGRFGVPFGSAQQTTITGDVQIDWLLNDDGSLRAQVFNRENVIRNFGEEIGYTQGLGLSYTVEFDTFKELLQIIFKGKNNAETQSGKNDESADIEKDKNLPEYMKMKRKNTKPKS